jgi:hypothetical protein
MIQNEKQEQVSEISALQFIFGLPLGGEGLCWQTNLDRPQAFKAFEAKRWGTIRRYGDKNWFLVAELLDGRIMEVRLSQNSISRKWLEAKRNNLVRRGNPYWGRNDIGARVYWEGQA